jgi:hypothetical protein
MVDLGQARSAVDAEVKGKSPALLRKKYTFFSLLSR